MPAKRAKISRTPLKERLVTERAEADKLFGSDIRLEITMPGVRGFLRVLRVPAKWSMKVLHDRVLIPALGMYPEYHLYQYHSLDKGMDRLTISVMANEFDDAPTVNECSLAQVLTRVDDVIEYEYDFGEGWRFLLKNLAIIPQSAGRAVVENGKLCGPPEDSVGLPGPANYGFAEFIQEYKKATPEAQKKMVKAVEEHCMNYGGKVKFDPLVFDTARCQELLDDPKKASGFSEKAPDLNKACERCGTLDQTTACPQCQKVYYCGRKCQAADATRHRPDCHPADADAPVPADTV